MLNNSKNSCFMSLLILCFMMSSTVVDAKLLKLKSSQIVKPFPPSVSVKPGALVTKYDLIEFTCPYGEKGFGLTPVNVDSSQGEGIKKLSGYKEGLSGSYFQILTSKTILREGDVFRLRCFGNASGVIQINEQYKVENGLEVVCKLDTSDNAEGNDDQYFTFKYMDGGYGKLRMWDRIQLFHVKTQTYITINPTKQVNGANYYEVFAGAEDFNDFTIFSLSRSQNYRPALNALTTKAFFGELIRDRDTIMLSNVDTLFYFRGANYGNMQIKVDNDYVQYAPVVGQLGWEGVSIQVSSHYIRKGSLVRIGYLGNRCIEAVHDQKSLSTPKHLLVAYTARQTNIDWVVEIVWGSDYLKGWGRSGDVYRLKNKNLGCYLRTSYRSYSGNGNEFLASELTCSPIADLATNWYINTWKREDNHFILSDNLLGVAPDFKPTDGPTANPFDDLNHGGDGKPADIFANNNSGQNSTENQNKDDEVCLI